MLIFWVQQKEELEVLVQQEFSFFNLFLVFKKMSAQEVEYVVL